MAEIVQLFKDICMLWVKVATGSKEVIKVLSTRVPGNKTYRAIGPRTLFNLNRLSYPICVASL